MFYSKILKSGVNSETQVFKKHTNIIKNFKKEGRKTLRKLCFFLQSSSCYEVFEGEK